ncbi:MAG: carboxylate-amine ligase [Caldilineales bacterium]|nr:carboxylate-amine ligase [Caldilineales bacterium]MDW8316584.1 carboxylate-amine ligase [Anaerolineae bacterium]
MKPPSLTIGVEEEYQIIDPETRELRSYITQFLESKEGAVEVKKGELKAGALKPELHASMVELGTPVCRTAAELKEALIAQRAYILDVAAQRGLQIAAASTHPFSHWLGQEITPFERYHTVLNDMQMLAQRMLIFGMHVHIGVEDRDFAIDCMNTVRYMLPHLLTLTTSSPFWAGRNTGLKSYRSVVFEDFPRTGLPESFPSWAAFERFVQRLVNTGCIPDGSKIWWDVRPHYSFPTLEFRVSDICTRVDEAVAVAALMQAIVAWMWDLRKKNMTFRIYRRDFIAENKWRALRYGLDGKLIDFGKEEEVPARQLIRELLWLVDEQIEELGSREEIEVIYRILEYGTSADRQLRVYQQHGGDANREAALRAVVDHLVQETKML